MSVLPQLERELLAAHRRLGERRRFRGPPVLGGGRSVRWLSRTIATVPVLLTLVVTFAIAGFALFVLHHGSTPSPQSGGPPPSPPAPLLPAHPSRRQQREVQYLEKAWGTVVRSDRGCSPEPRPLERPTINEGSPSQALLSILGVLRRPAVPTDKLPARVTYNPYTVAPRGSLPSDAREIYIRYIRRARWRFGAGYYIVPAGNINPGRAVPERCYTEQRNMLRRQLRGTPKQVRAATLALEPRFLAFLRYYSSPRPGVCLLALNSTGNGDGGCGGNTTVSTIESGHTIQTGGPTGVGVVYGLVPDGVATVTLYYHGHYPGHPITVRNIGNVFIAPDPGQRFPDSGFPYKAVWRSITGRVLKTITY